MSEWKITDFEDELMDIYPEEYKLFKNKNYKDNDESKEELTLTVLDKIEFLKTTNEKSTFNDSKNSCTDENEFDFNYKTKKNYDDNYVNDWQARELETIQMIRNFNIDSAANGRLDKNKTLPTIDIDKDYEYDGNFIVHYNERFFKVKDESEENDNNGNNDEIKVIEEKEKNEKLIEESEKVVPKRNKNNFDRTISNNGRSPQTLFDYFENIKFHTPREFYNRKKNCSKKKM